MCHLAGMYLTNITTICAPSLTTIQGMEDLIKQAFMQVDVLGPHVMEGHYDLIGPDGEIILPSVWEKVVQPDWAITMTMWPMDKMPPLHSKMPGGPHMHGVPGKHGPMPPPPRPMPQGMRPPGMQVPGGMPQGFAPPPGWPQGAGPRPPMPMPNVVTVGPGPVKSSKHKKPSKDHGSTVAGFLFGKPPKKK
jgi:hypothetical protein